MTRCDLTFSCILLKETDGYTGLCLDLDVASEGSSPIKAKRMLQEAVELYLDSAIENNVPYLRPVPKEEDPRHAKPDSIVEKFDLRVDLAVQVRA